MNETLDPRVWFHPLVLGEFPQLREHETANTVRSEIAMRAQAANKARE